MDLQRLSAASPNTATPLSSTADLANSPVTANGATAPLAIQLGTAMTAAKAAQGLANSAVQTSGGDVSNTIFVPAAGAQSVPLGSKLSRIPDPRDYGATGNAIRGILVSPVKQGDTAITLVDTALNGGITVPVGAFTYAFGGLLNSGTKVTSVTQNAASGSLPATTSVTLSTGFLAPVALTEPDKTYFDFSMHDDTAAFQAAYNQALSTGQNAVHVGPGFYALHSSFGPNPALSWQFDNALISQASAINDGPNAGIQQMPSGQTLLKTFVFPDNENGLQVDVDFAQTNSTHQYQKNAANFYFIDDDSGCFQALNGGSCNGSDGSLDIGRGAVGLSIQGQLGSKVQQGAMWGQESLIQIPAGTDGTVAVDEKSLVNNSLRAAPYLGDILNKEVATFLSSGTTPVSATIRVGGSRAATNGVWVDAQRMVENALVVGTDNGRNSAGVGSGYTAYAWIGHAGDVFGTSAHFGGGPASATSGASPALPGTDGRTLPSTGLSIDATGDVSTTGTIASTGTLTALNGFRAGAGAAARGGVLVSGNTAGQIDLGDSSLAAGNNLPLINFHNPTATGTDMFDLQIRDNGGALRVADGAGNQLLYASAAAGLEGTQLVATGTNGIVATLNGTRATGNLVVSLTGSGFDIIQETGSQAIYIKTAGGYNTKFNADGSTTMGGLLARTATNSLAGASAAQSSATALVKQISLLTACAAGASAFILPAGAASGSSYEIKVLNRSGNTCLVFPPVGGSIETGAINSSVSITSGTDMTFSSVSPTNWYQ